MSAGRFFDRNKNLAMIPAIFALAWPTMLEQLLQTAVQYIDTAMVGSLGTHATASVGATGTLNWLVTGTISAMGIGFLARISQSLGAGDVQQARKISAQSVLTALICGIVFTAAALGLAPQITQWMQIDPSIEPEARMYFMILSSCLLFRSACMIFGTVLRAAGDTKTPMKVGLFMNGINVLFNVLLIYPSTTLHLFGSTITIPQAGWQTAGAAAASAIAFCAGGVLMTWKLYRHPEVSFRYESIKPDWSILKPCFRISYPNVLQRFGTFLGFVVFATLINTLGPVAVAAHTVANTVESAFYIPGWGMQAAAATLAGNAWGARDEEQLHTLRQSILPLETALMTLSGLLLFLGAPSLVAVFSRDPEVNQLGTAVLRMVAVTEPIYGIPIVLEGIMMGMGNTKLPFVFNITTMWGIRIVGTWICIRLLHLGLISAWACMIAHNFALFVLFVSCHFVQTKKRTRAA